MKILIFTPDIEGHHLEYIHHIYQMAIESENNNFIFLLPKRFSELKNKLTWIEKNNVSFDLFDDSIFCVGKTSIISIIKNSYKVTKFVANKSQYYNVDAVYSNYLIVFLPFAPLFFKHGIHISGIIYRIYLYEEEYLAKFSLFLEKMKIWLLARSSVFHKVFILNDERSSDHFNTIYKTNKFIPIPDPYVPISCNFNKDIRVEYKIPPEKTLFTHFGAMNTNKGTIEIMKSLRLLSIEEKRQYSFFFAGRVSDEIRVEFYALLHELQQEIQINIVDEYCSYDFLASLCIASDCILTPYKRTSQSSGLIGYASQFGKPVICPNKGLLGYLVKKYQLGILLEDVNPQSLIFAYKKIFLGDCFPPNDDYCRHNNVNEFQRVLKKNIV